MALFIGFYEVATIYGQDIIYLKDDSKIEGKVQEVTPEKIKYKKLDNLSGPNFSVKKESALLVFSEKGSYLSMSELDNSALDANTITEKFNASLNQSLPSEDIIFTKTSARKGTITQDSDPLSFQTLAGTTESIAQSDIVAIIYRDGKHKINGDITEASEVLAKFRNIPEEKPIEKPIDSQSPTPSPAVAEKDNAWGNGITVSGKDVPVENIGGKNDNIDMGELGMVKFEEYSDRAVMKVNRFTEYIKLLSSQSTDFQESNKAINGAIELFLSEAARVEVSSINRPEKKKYRIREYLNRVKLIKYDKVEVEYSNVQYVGKLRKGANGLYYGVVSFEQVFRGYQDGRLVYEDRTVKNQTIVVKVTIDRKDGQKSLVWDVFLYDVGVLETRKN
jgi:hypothetical protein